MKTDFAPNYPDERYTATIKLTCTREEIASLYDMLEQAEPWVENEKSIKERVLNELGSALNWITEMEDIHSQMKEKHQQQNNQHL